ncbi:MAG: phosphoribosylglycinamide formyltransferase [Deltaproteobacteria bacterium]|nr:phosphoribosylglycinamide formyltransferase [Deltaproteobacteria bacterium]
MKLGVLVSGRGSNLEAILEAERRGALGPGRVAVVVSSRPFVRAVDLARAAGKPTVVVDHRGFDGREAFEDAVLAALHEHGVEAVALAGFMRILTPRFLGAFAPGRVLNIHPSLLPAFPGAHAHRDVLAAGARVTGATVHLVSAGVDQGAIVTQASVPVYPDDDEARLAARVLTAEHRIFPRALRWLAEGRLELLAGGSRVRVLPPEPERTLADRYANLHAGPLLAARAEARAIAHVAASLGRPVVAVSACLLGQRCRWDGEDRRDDGVLARVAGAEVLPICPEVLAGFGIPRPAMELDAQGVMRRLDSGADVSASALAGAEAAALLVREAGARRALLKQKSPSCGTRVVRQGGTGALVPGQGLLARALDAAGVTLSAEDDA